jgi:hypothetical protein
MATIAPTPSTGKRDPLRGLRRRADFALILAGAGLTCWIAAALRLG